MTDKKPPAAALARPAGFARAQLGPNGSVILALATTTSMEAFILGAEDAANAAVALLQHASSDPTDPVAYPVTDVVAGVADEEGLLVLNFKLGNGYLPLSLEAAEVRKLENALAQTSEAELTPPKPPAH